MSKLTNGPTALIAILALAFLLRAVGLTWGLPSSTHYFSYHPDESVVLGAAMHMDTLHGQWLPHFYNYGSLQLTLVNVVNTIAFVFGGVNIVLRDLATDYPQWARMYWLGRCLTVAMGVGTVWATAALGTRLWGRRAGLMGALLLALMPLHVQHSHWLTVDVPAAFWGMLALVWAARLAFEKDRSPHRSVLLAGLFVGLAAATKYNMALLLLPLFAAVLLAFSQQKKQALTLATLGVFASAAAFLIACPGSVLETPLFLRDLHTEVLHVGSQPGETFSDTGNGFLYTLAQTLMAGLGGPLLLCTVIALGFALTRRERGDALLAAFALPYYILISVAAVRYARYAIPLLPILALWTGRWLASVSRKPNQGKLAILGAAALALYTLWYTVWLIRPMTLPDTRDQALADLQAQEPSGLIAFPTEPWFQTVPVSPYFAMPRPDGWRQIDPQADRVLSSSTAWDLNTLQSGHPAAIVVSEYDTMDALRLRNPAAIAYLGWVHSKYQGRLLGNRRPPPGVFVKELPHDMLYPGPEIWLYRLKHF